jgi:hypothetical protein
VVVIERTTAGRGPTGRSSAICRAYYTNTFLASVWSPDGTKIVFDRRNPFTGETDIYSANADGRGLSIVAHTGA